MKRLLPFILLTLCFAAGVALDHMREASAAQAYQVLVPVREGTWSPTYTAETGSPVITYTAGIRGGRYTKLGRLVCVQGAVQTATVGAGGSDNVRVSLPFTAIANTSGTIDARSSFVVAQASGFVTNQPVAGQVIAGTAIFGLFYRATANGNGTSLTWADMTTGSTGNLIQFSGCYTAAS